MPKTMPVKAPVSRTMRVEFTPMNCICLIKRWNFSGGIKAHEKPLTKKTPASPRPLKVERVNFPKALIQFIG